MPTSASLEGPDSNRDAVRRAALGAAWELARQQGVAALSLREVAAAARISDAALTECFPTLAALYDAMFAEGNGMLLARLAVFEQRRDTENLLNAAAADFFAFCLEDSARYQLMFQRVMPDFVPSAASYAIAERVVATMRAALAAAGITRPEALDLWTALTTGLIDQQIANDPGGDRWIKLAPEAIRMFLDHERSRQ